MWPQRIGHSNPAGLSGRVGTQACLYAGPGIHTFESAERNLGLFRCASVFADTARTWPEYVRPWFLGDGNADLDWASWARGHSDRRLVITLSLVPTGVPPDWRDLGAMGRYDGWYRTLGHNLVAAGLGNSVIRLDPEANFKPGTESVGSDGAEIASWRTFWARAATALKATPGSHFRMDWTVNAGFRNLPLAELYPGPAAVDIIGVDAYDELVNGTDPSPGLDRWRAVAQEPDGLESVARFAQLQRKPLSVPEWGLLDSWAGAGDDPDYVNGMLSAFTSEHVLYESYFDNHALAGVLPIEQAPRSLALYRSSVDP